MARLTGHRCIPVVEKTRVTMHWRQFRVVQSATFEEIEGARQRLFGFRFDQSDPRYGQTIHQIRAQGAG